MVQTKIEKQLPTDTDGKGIQVAGTQQYEDGASSPVPSPVTGVGTTPQKITIPTGAVSFVYSADGDTYYGKATPLVKYTKGYADKDIRVACAGGEDIYIRAVTGTVTLWFTFEVLQG